MKRWLVIIWGFWNLLLGTLWLGWLVYQHIVLEMTDGAWLKHYGLQLLLCLVMMFVGMAMVREGIEDL